MKKIVLASLLIVMSLTACFRKQGCTSSNAFNFDIDAKVDNGLCEFAADAFAGYYDGTESIYHISISGDTLTTRSDSFIIFLSDTNRIQLRGFYDCATAQDTIGCVVIKYDAFASGVNPCATGWQDFKLSREGDSLVRYSYQKYYATFEKDSIIGYAIKR